MGTRHEMRDANLGEERVEFFILSSLICLHSNDFPIKESFHKALKLMEFLKNFGFKFKEINPCEFAKIINEAHIIFIPSY
jgi:hypothetical protein